MLALCTGETQDSNLKAHQLRVESCQAPGPRVGPGEGRRQSKTSKLDARRPLTQILSLPNTDLGLAGLGPSIDRPGLSHSSQ